MIFFERDNFNVWLEKHKANLATYYILTTSTWKVLESF